MIQKQELIQLNQKVAHDYSLFKNTLNEAIHNGSLKGLESLYENLIESAYAAVDKAIKYDKQKRSFHERVQHRKQARIGKKFFMYPYTDKTASHAN